jgi:hypothetical protein
MERATAARRATVPVSSRWTSEARIDLAVLVSAFFLQRFSLSFGNSLMSLDVVPTICILVHQFVSGKLLISYDRLLWFLALGLAGTCSLYLNFNSGMLPSYSEFVVMYFLFTLSRPASVDRYKSTLQAFQFLVMVLSVLAIGQFFAQLVLDGRQLVMFYGIVPDFLFASYNVGGANTIIPITDGSSLIKSNGIFLAEPSTLSLITALGILIELLEFGRPRYLFLLAFGYLLSYSGSGLMMLVVFLPLASLVRGRAMQYALLLPIFVFGLAITGIVDLSVFVGRMGEFEDTRASGHGRYIGPFWLLGDYLHLASPRELLIGNGPGTTGAFTGQFRFSYTGGMTATWIKLLYEYGLIGSFIFILFLAGCCRRTPCPKIIVAAVFFSYVFIGGNLINTPFQAIMIVLLTLSGPKSRRGHVNATNQYRPSFVEVDAG